MNGNPELVVYDKLGNLKAIEIAIRKNDLPLHTIQYINTKYPEYAPVVTADEKKIIYTSNRPNSTFNPKVQSDGHYMEDIYVSEKDENNQWQL